MKKVLLVKTTSLGDLIHLMPAVTDLQNALPGVELHWLVEESFAAIPLWHPFVKKVHTCAIRRWRKKPFSRSVRQEIAELKKTLRAEGFDRVIDAQGLVKSAWMVRWLDAEKHGYDKNSIREPFASRVYDVKHTVSRAETAISRNRQLLAAANGYAMPADNPCFGMQIVRPDGFDLALDKPFCVFLHGTNWNSKIWPVEYWALLAQVLKDQGVRVFVPWGDDTEKARAQAIAEDSAAVVLPRQTLTGLAFLLQNAAFVVGSDTGLSHISAALDTLTVGLYGSTNAALTGLVGSNVISLQSKKACSPCMKRECPLVAGNEIIPCYQDIGVEPVLDTLRSAGMRV